MRRLCRIAGVSAALLGLLCAPRAYAGDPFEIQVYDGTADPPGVPGIELHLNNWSTRSLSTPPEAPLSGQFHATLEPSLGIAPFWELGAYVQMAVRTDAAVVDWAGAKLRSKFVTPPGWDDHWRLGLNFELSYLPETYDHNRWGSEVRPIVAWQNDRWLFAFNPIIDQALGPPDARGGPEFEPALKIARAVGPVAVGIEYYATLGPLSALLPWRDQEQQVFEVLDVLSLPRIELELGVGQGLTASSEGVVMKAILGYTWESTAPRQQLGAIPLRAPRLR